MLIGMPNPTANKPILRIPGLGRTNCDDAPLASANSLADFVSSHSNLLILTGAGLSTQSGIPAYRDKEGQWMRRTPIFYQDFIRCPIARRRYWARSYFGWHHVAKAQPNKGHLGLAQLQVSGHIETLITQNVDGLHLRAGSHDCIEVHGQLGLVKCLDCHARYTRGEVQQQLMEMNLEWSAEVLGFNPDGDVDLDEAAYPDFKVANCTTCGGRLKPDVVFFGESVPSLIHQAIQDAIGRCDGLLVIGSSLVVMSGYRVVKQVHAQEKPIVAINNGRTRADHLLRFKVPGDCVGRIDELCRTLR